VVSAAQTTAKVERAAKNIVYLQCAKEFHQHHAWDSIKALLVSHLIASSKFPGVQPFIS